MFQLFNVPTQMLVAYKHFANYINEDLISDNDMWLIASLPDSAGVFC